MAIRIPPNQIQNLQQMEAVVAGPDDANRLFIVAGQFSGNVNAFSPTNNFVQQSETFTVLVGPVFTRREFFRAIATAALTRTAYNVQTVPGNLGWTIVGIDADWDDESGQVELRIEVSVNTSGTNNSSSVGGLGFQVTILAAVAG